MEWLAFEIEHAEMFARAFLGRRPGRRPGKPGDPERKERPGEPGESPPPPPFELTLAETVDGIQSMDDDDNEPDFSSGYLYIYRTTRPLTNLVYIDGCQRGRPRWELSIHKTIFCVI
jgi:hypothetical protein